MTIALVSNVAFSGLSGGTSSAINTTGATLLVMSIATVSNAYSPSDSYGNTWYQITSEYSGSGNAYNIVYCAINPTVGSGHTFTYSGTTTYACVQISAWSGVTTSTTPVESWNGATGSSSTLATGSITPNQNGSLLIATFAINNSSGSATINDSFTISNQIPWNGSANFGAGQAYLVQTTAAAIDPTWTFAASGANSATITAFGTSPSPIYAEAAQTVIEAIGSGNPAGLVAQTIFEAIYINNPYSMSLPMLKVMKSQQGWVDDQEKDDYESSWFFVKRRRQPGNASYARAYQLLAESIEQATPSAQAFQLLAESIETGTPSARAFQFFAEAIYPNNPPPAPPKAIGLRRENAFGLEHDELEEGYSLLRVINRKLRVAQPLQANATVTIPSVSGTGAVGTLRSLSSNILGGVAGTGQAGTVVKASVLTGVNATASVGSLSIREAVQAAGAVGTGEAGVPPFSRTISLSGVAGSGHVGSVFRGVTLKDPHATGAVGILSLIESTNYPLAGVAGTGTAGGPHVYLFFGVHGAGEAGGLAGMPFLISGVAGTGEARGPLTTGLAVLGVSGTGAAGVLNLVTTLHVTNVVREVLLQDGKYGIIVDNIAREVLVSGSPLLHSSGIVREVLSHDINTNLQVGSIVREVLLSSGLPISNVLVVVVT